MNPIEEYKNLYERLYAICEENEWGDPFSYARSREIHIAGTLGHKIFDKLSGADAIDEDGECEYKSTIAKNINGSYNGIAYNLLGKNRLSTCGMRRLPSIRTTTLHDMWVVRSLRFGN